MNETLKFITRPEGKELRNIIDLWHRIFLDDEAFVSALISSDSYAGVAYMMYDHKLVGMAHLLKIENCKAYYCYAVATEEKYRGKGICAKILDFLKEKSKNEGAALLLHPATPKLASYYKKQGFDPLAYSYDVKCQGDGAEIFDISSAEYKRMRDFQFGGLGFFGWSEEVLSLSGARFIGFDIDGEYMGAAIVNERVCELCAPIHKIGQAYRRAANAADTVVITDEASINDTVSVLGYNVSDFGYFNLFLD